MKINRILLAFLLIMVLLMTSCSIAGITGQTEATKTTEATASVTTEQAEESDPMDETNAVETAAEQKEDVWNPYVAQRQILLDENSMCGVIFLGDIDPEATDLADDRAYYQSVIEESGYADGFDFLLEIPDEKFAASYIGQELFVIIPYDENATVLVNQLTYDEENDYAGTADHIIASFDNGAPFLLKCNQSEIYADTEIIITDSNGSTLSWRPFISKENGRVVTEAGDKKVCDFTVY